MRTRHHRTFGAMPARTGSWWYRLALGVVLLGAYVGMGVLFGTWYSPAARRLPTVVQCAGIILLMVLAAWGTLHFAWLIWWQRRRRR